MSTTNDLHTATQFSIFLANKPGSLATIVQRMADQKINIVALSMMDATEHGVLRLITGDADHARRSLNSLDMPRTEQTVLMATLPNRPGALADVLARLAGEHINVHYAYCTTGAAGGRTLGVFKVDNVTKAVQVLGERKPKRKSETMAVRGNSRARAR